MSEDHLFVEEHGHPFRAMVPVAKIDFRECQFKHQIASEGSVIRHVRPYWPTSSAVQSPAIFDVRAHSKPWETIANNPTKKLKRPIKTEVK